MSACLGLTTKVGEPMGRGPDLPDRWGSFSLRSTRPLMASSMQKQGPYFPGSVQPRHPRPPMSNATWFHGQPTN
jgi:hypothetical protein